MVMQIRSADYRREIVEWRRVIDAPNNWAPIARSEHRSIWSFEWSSPDDPVKWTIEMFRRAIEFLDVCLLTPIMVRIPEVCRNLKFKF